jgi:hypothetical protein
MNLPLFFIIGELSSVDNVVEYAINGRLIIEEQPRLHRLYSPSFLVILLCSTIQLQNTDFIT